MLADTNEGQGMRKVRRPLFQWVVGERKMQIQTQIQTNTQKDKNTLMLKIPKHRNEEQGERKARRRLFQWVVDIFVGFEITEYRTRSKY